LGKKRSTYGVKLNLLLFTQKLFGVGKKNLRGYKKKPDLNLPQVDDIISPKMVGHYFSPRRLLTFYPQEGKKKISRLFSEFE